MKKQTVNCPKCNHRFEVSKLLEHQIEERLRSTLETEQSEWRDKERARLERKLRAELKDASSLEMQELREALVEKDSALRKSQKLELEVRRKARELEQKAETFEVEKARILDQERDRIQRAADLKAEEKHKIKLHEKDLQLKSLSEKIDELQRKSEKTSQELQGTAQEVCLLDALQTNFVEDGFLRVGKGRKGGDIVHTINANTRKCGIILWESKNTASWSSSWLEKARNDRNAERADIAIIVTATMPADTNGAVNMDGIWVCDFKTAPILAAALRNGLIELSRVQATLENRSDMTDVVVRYLTSLEFKQRIERVCRTLVAMKAQVEKERTQTIRWFSERDAQLNLIAEDVHGFRGELEAMLQTSLPGTDRVASLPESPQLALSVG